MGYKIYPFLMDGTIEFLANNGQQAVNAAITIAVEALVS